LPPAETEEPLVPEEPAETEQPIETKTAPVEEESKIISQEGFVPDGTEQAPEGEYDFSAITKEGTACQAEMPRLMNAKRKAIGLKPMKAAPPLSELAQFWAEHQASTNKYGFMDSLLGKKEAAALVLSTGYNNGVEFSAVGYKNSKELVNAWAKSHLTAKKDKDYKYIGAGCAKAANGRMYYSFLMMKQKVKPGQQVNLEQPTKAKASIQGRAVVGATLKSVVTGTTPIGTKYKYQWFANGKAIKGATKKDFVVTAAQMGKTLQVRVTVSKKYYKTVKLTSAKTQAVTKLPQWARKSGADRYSTSLAILKENWKAGTPLLIASGASFPDALAAAPAANKVKGGLLLTPGGALPAAHMSFLKANKPSKVYIIGGAKSVSNGVLNQIKGLKVKVDRVQGSDRYETAGKIATTFFKSATVAYIASGAQFPDALTAAAAAGSIGAPVLLVDPKDSYLKSAASFPLIRLNVSTLRIAGGHSAVSAKLEKSSKNLYKVTRYGGKDRYETAQKINSVFGVTAQVWIASGDNFPDALAGAAAAGAGKEPLYLAKKRCVPAGSFKAFAKHKPVSKVVLGGPALLNSPLGSCK